MVFNAATGFSCGVALVYGLASHNKADVFKTFIKKYGSQQMKYEIYTWSDNESLKHGQQLMDEIKADPALAKCGTQSTWRINPTHQSRIRLYTFCVTPIAKKRLNELYKDILKEESAKQLAAKQKGKANFLDSGAKW
jgi:hypothetical protein